MADSDVSDFYESDEYEDSDEEANDLTEQEDLEDSELEDQEFDDEVESEEEVPDSDDEDCYAGSARTDYLEIDDMPEITAENVRLEGDDRVTRPIMTYYELVRLIGTRAQQFNLGATPLVDGLIGLPVQKMAYLEIMSHMSPFILRRHLPNSKYEDWKLEELLIPHIITDDFFLPGEFDWDSLMSYAQNSSDYIQMVKEMQEISKLSIH